MELVTIDSNCYIDRLPANHNEFNCGIDGVNEYLYHQAQQDSDNHINRTFVVLLDRQITAFYTTGVDNVAIDVENNAAIEYHLPVLKVVALGVHRPYQRHMIGSKLMMSIYQKAVNIHKEVALTGVYLIAYRDAVPFYEKMGMHLVGGQHLLNIPTMNEFKMAISMEEIYNLFPTMIM